MMIEELNEQYKTACTAQTKQRINQLLSDYIDDETIDSVRKQTVLNMIVSLTNMR